MQTTREANRKIFATQEDYKIAYQIQKKAEGYYVVVEFKAPHTLPKELDRRLKISDNVMRHIIINKDEK